MEVGNDSNFRARGMSAPTGNSSLEQPLPEYEFQRQVLKSLNILRMNLQQQGDLISSLVPLQASSPAAPLVVTEPFHSVELLESFQHHLTNQKEEQLVLFMLTRLWPMQQILKLSQKLKGGYDMQRTGD
ncbi:uncharacterized protein LOC135376885 [Ornithodoros turicata]|uniref:uncharacterized protein LOC135376885 n=1 Tax=Ornithodoros turicata TaxID=34597 RepID=UPI00313886A8